MLKDRAAFIFYSTNIALLLVGVDLWLRYSIVRVVILYSIFNIVLFRVSVHDDRSDGRPRGIASTSVFKLLTMALVVLLAVTIAGTYESLYARPSFLVAATGMVIVLFVAILLVSNGQREFKESYALLGAISIVIFVEFGTYLAQPNLTSSPLYAGVDAYRDYANAFRILMMSRVDPNMMILTQYYRAFPVVPIEIAIASLVVGLPLNISHLILAAIADGVAVTSLFLLSKRIAGDYARNCSCLLFLPVLLVFLQPALVNPDVLVLPLKMSIPIVTMIVYLAYTRVLGSAPNRSVSVALILLVMIVVPLHGASAMFVMLLIAIMIIAGRRARTSLLRLEILAMTIFFLYLFFSAGGPYASIVDIGQEVWSFTTESFGLGARFVPELASRVLANSSLSETDSFLMSTVPALILSIFTIFVVKLAKERRNTVAGVTQRSFHIVLGILLIFGFGMGLVGPFWNIDARYFTFPLTPVAVMAAAMVILWMLGDLSFRRRILVGGLLSLCVLSMLTSPYYLESNPAHTRMMPIESEANAAMFVSTHFDASSSVTQVVSDWPYYNEVEALLYSYHIGLEDKVTVPNLMYDPMGACQETMMLSRRLFMESSYLQTISPHVKSLSDNSTWLHFNKVYDAYSVSIYIGRLSC